MMKKFLAALALSACSLTALGCEAQVYDVEPAYASASCGAVPADGVMVESCVYYRVVVYDGVPYRYYYQWGAHGWYYHSYQLHHGAMRPGSRGAGRGGRR